MSQLVTHFHLTRSRGAATHRINAFASQAGRASAACEICPRYVRPHLLSDRGWCPECERQFSQVMASPQVIRFLTRAA